MRTSEEHCFRVVTKKSSARPKTNIVCRSQRLSGKRSLIAQHFCAPQVPGHNFAGESPGVPARLSQSRSKGGCQAQEKDSFALVFARQAVPSPNSGKSSVSDSQHLSVCGIKKLRIGVVTCDAWRECKTYFEATVLTRNADHAKTASVPTVGRRE
ncbi:hypothetical protein CEXT_451601 [Caerostris extrusa]|uniref:Uncharacterized protein n=1 Tax=Caerostris extrusa TaxID=172846 RepID=A0AAV4W6S1_CAEEX|nr:hypothetical protein CEXT_451601 [Caerostris extrusa]